MIKYSHKEFKDRVFTFLNNAFMYQNTTNQYLINTNCESLWHQWDKKEDVLKKKLTYESTVELSLLKSIDLNHPLIHIIAQFLSIKQQENVRTRVLIMDWWDQIYDLNECCAQFKKDMFEKYQIICIFIDKTIQNIDEFVYNRAYEYNQSLKNNNKLVSNEQFYDVFHDTIPEINIAVIIPNLDEFSEIQLQTKLFHIIGTCNENAKLPYPRRFFFLILIRTGEAIKKEKVPLIRQIEHASDPWERKKATPIKFKTPSPEPTKPEKPTISLKEFLWKVNAYFSRTSTKSCNNLWNYNNDKLLKKLEDTSRGLLDIMVNEPSSTLIDVIVKEPNILISGEKSTIDQLNKCTDQLEKEINEKLKQVLLLIDAEYFNLYAKDILNIEEYITTICETYNYAKYNPDNKLTNANKPDFYTIFWREMRKKTVYIFIRNIHKIKSEFQQKIREFNYHDYHFRKFATSDLQYNNSFFVKVIVQEPNVPIIEKTDTESDEKSQSLFPQPLLQQNLTNIPQPLLQQNLVNIPLSSSILNQLLIILPMIIFNIIAITLMVYSKEKLTNKQRKNIKSIIIILSIISIPWGIFGVFGVYSTNLYTKIVVIIIGIFDVLFISYFLWDIYK